MATFFHAYCTCIHMFSIPIIVYMRISKNHNSLGCEQPLGLDVNQSPDIYTCRCMLRTHIHLHVYTCTAGVCELAMGRTCKNGATCVNIGVYEYRCKCPPEYEGRYCGKRSNYGQFLCVIQYQSLSFGYLSFNCPSCLHNYCSVRVHVRSGSV